MLKILRHKKTAKKIWIGLAIIIIPAFTLWGFGGAFRSKEEKDRLKSNFGRSVNERDFKESLSAVRTLAIMQLGDKLPEYEKYLNLDQQAWERAILLHEARRRRINASDKEVTDTIQSYPFFRDKRGFNIKAYNEALRYIFRLQPRIFEEQTRQNLIMAKLYESITKNIKITDLEIRQEFEKVNQALSIDYLAAFFTDYAKKIKPNTQELSAFFEKNKAMFKEPASKDKPVHFPELNEIKDKVTQIMIKEESQRVAQDKIKEYLPQAKQIDFKQIAKESGLKTGQTEFFKSTDQIKDLGDGEIFWKSAKQLDDKNTLTTLTNENGSYIIKLAKSKPVDEAKFKQEKTELGIKLLSEKKSAAFNDFTAELIKKSL